MIGTNYVIIVNRISEEYPTLRPTSGHKFAFSVINFQKSEHFPLIIFLIYKPTQIKYVKPIISDTTGYKDVKK